MSIPRRCACDLAGPMVTAVLRRGRAGVARDVKVLGRASFEELAVLKEGRNMNIVCVETIQWLSRGGGGWWVEWKEGKKKGSKKGLKKELKKENKKARHRKLSFFRKLPHSPLSDLGEKRGWIVFTINKLPVHHE